MGIFTLEQWLALQGFSIKIVEWTVSAFPFPTAGETELIVLF